MLSVEEIEDCFPEFEQEIDDGSGHTALIGVSPRWLHEFARAIECKCTVVDAAMGEKKDV